METLRRSRIPTVVTANGEVQTNEEAQVFVHDLDLFVTVQILDDTPVLLLGKLCDEHGCFYKWVSGKQPRLTKQGKKKHILQNGRFRTSCCPWIVEFFYISIAGETKSSTREVNLWYKILPLSGFNLIRAKQKQTSQETEKSLRKFLEPSEKPNIYADNSLAIGKSCEDLTWNHRTSAPHRSETNGVAERAVRRVRGNVCCAVAIRLGWKMVGWFIGMLLLSAKCPRLPGRWENSLWKAIRRTIWRANNSFWSIGWMSSDFHTRPVQTSPLWKESSTGIFLGHALIAGRIWKGDILVADIEELEKMDASEIYPRRINEKEILTPQKGENSYSQLQMVQQNCWEETTKSEKPLQGGSNL